MTRHMTRLMLILAVLALFAALAAGCARRAPRAAIITPEPVSVPAGKPATAAPSARATAAATSTPRPTSSPTSSFVPTVLASVEKTVTVASEMVDCPGEGAGGGKCYRVKEEGATEWVVYPGRIEKFEFWPGAEYVIVVREDKIANAPPGSSDLMWTIVKGLYQINVPRTPQP